MAGNVYKPKDVLPRFQPVAWQEYAYKGASLRHASIEDLSRIVRRAAKTANQRMRRLEKAGETEAPAYKIAVEKMGGRKRFKERPGKKPDRKALITEYYQLMDFLMSKSSTVTGLKDIRNNRYQAAVERGFEGTPDEFEQLVEKYYTKHVESLLSSDVIYMAIYENRTDILDEIMRDYDTGQLKRERSMMSEYIRRFEGITE